MIVVLQCADSITKCSLECMRSGAHALQLIAENLENIYGVKRKTTDVLIIYVHYSV